MPGLPHGKRAGVPCPHLDADLRCQLFGLPTRPAVCSSLRPSPEMCGESREQAMSWLHHLEQATSAAVSPHADPNVGTHA